MKVKVNGAWVDVPAFKVVEKGNGHGVIEGEITIVGNVKSLQVDYDELPNEPFCASIENNDPEAYLSGSGDKAISVAFVKSNITTIRVNRRAYSFPLINAEYLSDSPMGKNSTIFSTWGSQNFVLGTYTYKIAY